MNKECLTAYREKLEKGIQEYMQMPLSQRSAEAVESMVECWEHITGMMKAAACELSEADCMAWNASMQNGDGTIGGHWTISETAGSNPGIEDHLWNVAVNMMYSDYFSVAERYGVATEEFFEDMAKAFLDDKDAPEDKLSEYYCHIVTNGVTKS